VIAAVPVEFSDSALATEVMSGLALVKEGLRQAVHAQHEVLAEASSYLIIAGGKRLRPTLVLLAAQFGNPCGGSRTRPQLLTWAYAVRSYSLMWPPRTGRRWIRSLERSATGWSGRGGRSWRLR
jgi:hypothetical protein